MAAKGLRFARLANVLIQMQKCNYSSAIVLLWSAISHPCQAVDLFTNPYPADHDFGCVLPVLLFDQMTVFGNEMCV